MSKLPDKVTWAVCQDGSVSRPICVEASSPQRLNSFRRRYGGDIRIVTRPWGQTWDGQPMDSHALKILRHGIYRNWHRRADGEPAKPEGPAYCFEAVAQLIQEAAGHHGVRVADLLDPPDRSTKFARARGYAARILKDRVGLTLDQIADMLNYKDHSSAWRWLQQPLELLATPYRKEPRRVRKEEGAVH